MVERLIEAGASVHLVDARGYTALQCAAEGGHMGPFRPLLQAGCDPMAQDHAGSSVLHSACQGGCLEIINELQNLGADPSDRTLQGRDCLHYAALGNSPLPLHLFGIFMAQFVKVAWFETRDFSLESMLGGCMHTLQGGSCQTLLHYLHELERLFTIVHRLDKVASIIRVMTWW